MSFSPGKSAASVAFEKQPAYLAIIAGLPVAAWPIKPGKYLIGRAPDATWRLDHLEVSRRHCQLTCDENGVCAIEDLDSQWGTRVNQQRISAPTVLQPGDRLALGSVVLLFEKGAMPANQELERRGAESGSEISAAPILQNGRPVSRVVLGEHVTFGREDSSDVVLKAPAVSRQHAVVRRTSDGFRVFDLQSTAGSFVNGQRFDDHDLTIGDRLQIGAFFFRFDGSGLEVVGASGGAPIAARKVSQNIHGQAILDDVSLDIPPSRFAGIIGPSGAGKSSLLGALSGLRPAGSGTVLIGGVDVQNRSAARALGFVPQDDLVHLELTVEQALRFAAQLRLPARTPRHELRKLVAKTIAQLGLDERAALRIGSLSGGQRKRVSVAVELLARPPVLFLDEPTSGLDPATEFKMMELLRDLADTGCTVVCTTHVMENVFLMDQVAVMSGGCLVFNGTPQEAREFFGVPRLPALYEKLAELPLADWRMQFAARREKKPLSKAVPIAPTPRRAARAFPLGVLLRRQGAIWNADWRNHALTWGQPLVLAALVAWVSDDASLELFFACIATLWFGCSNGAPEIVREIAIFRRERMVGIGRAAYVASKFLFLGPLTAAQSLLFYICLQIGEHRLAGSPLWQSTALLALALAAAGLGILISALARTLLQAVVTVPLALIPLILFSGYTVPAHEMKPAVALVGSFTPSFAAQTLMDVSFLWQQKIAHQTLADHWTSFRNLNRDGTLRTGDIFQRPAPGAHALAMLLAWIAGTFGATYLSLRAREKNL